MSDKDIEGPGPTENPEQTKEDIKTKHDKMRKNAMHDLATSVHDDIHTDGFLIKQEQHIPQNILSDLKKERLGSLNAKEGDHMRVASVPVAVHEQWLREGFDMFKESARDIVKRLQDQDLHAFITTKKQV